MEKILAAVLGTLIVGSTPAFGQLLWCWNLAGPGVSGAGTFTTGNDPDAEGFYRIIGITGTVDTATVSALQPTGTSIPGNSGYPVDNLIRATTPQLTKHGFGFVASDGSYHNPFHVGQYRDYISRPPYPDGKGAEPIIEFKAVVASGPHCATE